MRIDLFAQISPFPWSPGHSIQDNNYLLLLLEKYSLLNSDAAITVLTPLSGVLLDFLRIHRDVFSGLSIRYCSPSQRVTYYPESDIFTNEFIDQKIVKEFVAAGRFIDASTSHSCPYICGPHETGFVNRNNGQITFSSTNAHVVRKHLDYNKLNYASTSLFSAHPKPLLDPVLSDPLSIQSGDYVLFYIREKPLNGCLPIAFEEYVPSIKYLQDLGYKIIYPNYDEISISLRDKLVAHNILIYSDFPRLGFKYDYQLYSNCALYFGSNCGPASFFALSSIPALWIGQWISPALAPPTKAGFQIPSVPRLPEGNHRNSRFQRHALLPMTLLPGVGESFYDDFQQSNVLPGKGNPFNTYTSVSSALDFDVPQRQEILNDIITISKYTGPASSSSFPRRSSRFCEVEFNGSLYPVMPISEVNSWRYN